MIICEDRYGVGFFEQLANRLKNEGFIPGYLNVKAARFYGPCNTKLDRQIKALAYLSCFNFFLVVADADGESQQRVKERIEGHVPKELRNSCNTVVLRHEVEEWICYDKGIQIDDKPSIILKEKEGYEKYKLDSYVAKLDINRLRKGCVSFCDFIECLLKCPEC